MSNTGKGAAEEPEPEPDPPPSATAAAAAAPYDPRKYQPPHPDDRGGKPSKKKGGSATAKGGGKGDGKGSKGGAKGPPKDDDTHRCGNCDAPDAKSKCKGCGVEYYCNRESPSV